MATKLGPIAEGRAVVFFGCGRRFETTIATYGHNAHEALNFAVAEATSAGAAELRRKGLDTTIKRIEVEYFN